MNSTLSPETLNFFDDFDGIIDVQLETVLNTVQAGKIEAEAMETIITTMDTAWANGDKAMLQMIAMNVAASACSHDHLGPFSEALNNAYPQMQDHNKHSDHDHDHETDDKKKKTKKVFGWFLDALLGKR